MNWSPIVCAPAVVAVCLALAVSASIRWFVIPSASDAQEAGAICRAVKMSGAVPPHGTVAWRGAVRYRPLLVYGVEAPDEQEAILVAARDARDRYSSCPVRVIFHRARVVHDGHGGAEFPGGTRVIRTATIE